MVNLRAKCIVCGDSTAGKTALCQVFHSDGSQYPKNYLMTSGVDLLVKSVNVCNSTDTLELFLYDCAGKPLFHDQIKRHWDNVSVIMVVYDVSSEQSFKSCSKWIKNVRNEDPETNIPGVLVANKIDLEERRVVTAEQGKELAKSEDLEYFECSAKELRDVDAPFVHLATLYRSMYLKKIEELQTQS